MKTMPYGNSVPSCIAHCKLMQFLLLKGMEELHKSSVSCHGNLKSTNVLVDSHWICRVADYGLKSFRENKLLTQESLQTQSGEVCLI